MLSNLFQNYQKPFPAGVKLPTIRIEKRFYDELGLEVSTSNLKFLKVKCEKSLFNYLSKNNFDRDKYIQRLDYELSIFDELGFIDYILLNWDVINFCHENGIPTGFGRGSAAGSLVLFLLNVTRVDPIRYDLFFERFVSKSRARKIESEGEIFLDGSLLCDVDNDISYERRQEVINYIESKFKGYTCKILTLNTLSSKLCIKECCKLVGEFSEEKANQISSFIPKKFGKVESIQKSCEESPQFNEFRINNPKIFKIAKKIEGLNKNTGVHPSGIAISYYPVRDIMPIQSTNDGHIVSGYDMNGVSELMVKFDILGLRTLSVVDKTCKKIGIKMEDIDPNDEFIYTAFQVLDKPKGIFQIEADTNFKIAAQVKPKNLHQLSDCVALGRPGALSFVDMYASNINSDEDFSVHPFFSDILNYTGGLPLYQEQLMKMANKVGFSLDEAEQLRRIVGKKKVDQMQSWKSKIEDKISENNLDPAIGDILWKVAEDSANYSFNLSHSISYSVLSAITMYLKFKYTKEFFLSLLDLALYEPNPIEEISIIAQELSYFGIKLLPPDLSKSQMSFSIEGNNIRYGLNAIKGISEKSLNSLIEFRGFTFNNIYDVFMTAKECGINIGVLCSLIQAGALDSMTDSRNKTILHACSFNLLTDRAKRNIIKLGERFNYDVLKTIYACAKEGIVGDDNKKIFTESTFETFKRNYEKYKKVYDLNSKYPEFANWYFENKILGYSHSGKLKNIFVNRNITDIIEVKRAENDNLINICGTITDVASGISANGNSYMRVQISDETDNITCLLMNNRRANKLDEFLASNQMPEKNNIVVCSGRKLNDAIFIDTLSVLDKLIYIKLSELK